MYPRSVVISALVHAAVLAAAVIVPLLAADVLPAIHQPMSPYVRVFRPADIPLPAPRVPALQTRTVAAPTVAPIGIAPENPQVPVRSTGPIVPFGLEGLASTGVPAEFGTGESIAPIPPPTPPPPTVSAPVPQPTGGRIKTPARVAYVAPLYPLIAQSAHVQGDVVLEAVIGVDGSVQDLRVVRGVALLDEAALDAVRRWHYTPTLLNGVAVPVVMTVTVSFRLR
jgi:protein TonB